MHELFNMLCFQYKLVSIEYFMDTMQEWEISIVCECLPYADRAQWEMTRLLMYQNIQLNTNKHIEITDVLKFKWDKDQIEDAHDIEISNDDIMRMKEVSSNIFQLLPQE